MKFSGCDVSVVRRPVKNIRISVLPDKTIKVVAPPGFDVNSVLNEKKAWILKHVRQISENTPCSLNDDKFLIYGIYYDICGGDSCRIDFQDEVIFYSSPSDLENYLKERLKNDLTPRLDYFSEDMGVSYNRYSVKKQKTRWGSCSSKGNLNFNLRLIGLPPHLRDYVIVHELAHLKEMNHSRSFWSVVENHCPLYRDHRKELKKYWLLLNQNKIWTSLLE
ncbi:M48 family metallopeptidase [Methanoplanus sp. FWC-SCC4]|uniref:M48 family metallopeptidase n=1 Tax=Methanochimaera problematica TaxID=2609417 RepID=A0AA97I4P2_9EURY|nr:SprT family zinc-dependent metalloprotease [Methanoplanus sp. FWC-SCC4]WOF16709.1 M48 family metallopeptidase [Methanoplanus sp. FWC-SCC4]